MHNFFNWNKHIKSADAWCLHSLPGIFPLAWGTLVNNYEKHASRVSQVIAAVAKVSCKHGLWLVARVNKSSAARYAMYLTDRAVFIMAGYIMILNVIYPFSSQTAVIFPLCDSTIDFASDNPIPDPPVSEFLELSGL